MPGEFAFHSDEAERVLMTSGSIEILFTGDSEWKTVSAGEAYNVPASCNFKVKCTEISEYICDFLKKES